MEKKQTQIKLVLIWFSGKYLSHLLLLLMKCLLYSHLVIIPNNILSFILSLWWWWIGWSRTVLFSIKSDDQYTTKGTGATQKETLPWLIAFFPSHFHPLVYKALVINPTFRPQFRSLGRQTKVPPIHQNSIDTSHLANSLLILPLPEFFQHSHPSSYHLSQLVPHYGVSHLVPFNVFPASSLETRTNSPPHLRSGNLPPKSNWRLLIFKT